MTAPDVFTWMAGQAANRPRRARSGTREGEKHRPGAGRPFSLPQAKYDEIAALLREGVLSQRKIAALVDVSRSHVSNMAKRLAEGRGVPVVPDAPRYTDEQVQELARLVAGGMTVPKAAGQLGLAEATARGIIRDHLGTTVAELRAEGVPQ
ncbi:helix-turn-helix domain-containing protein [Achromobacter phage Mano]|uniref:Helix-turn-helix domain-containing protein n=1 Tax=Achromobacter phage Mano TaxID=2767570 RepID=A0A7L8G7H5_9CAUD|nr:helix-turn-helix domain-containing protein [Achromobacter phage Mano]QOE32781.1 helix-turn-helix domain-containing protein [Achromobacter phage Mano]